MEPDAELESQPEPEPEPEPEPGPSQEPGPEPGQSQEPGPEPGPEPERGARRVGGGPDGGDGAGAMEMKEAGNIQFKSKNYQQAIELYSRAAALDPSCAVYFCNRSTCYAALSDWPGARRSWPRAAAHRSPRLPPCDATRMYLWRSFLARR